MTHADDAPGVVTHGGRTRRLVPALVAPVVVLVALLLGGVFEGDDDAGVQIASAVEEEDRFEHEYVIPLGTADDIESGKQVEIVPRELVAGVGEAIRIVNEDDEDHLVGVFFVAAGETLTQRFTSAGVLEGECSVHPSGAFTLRVEA